METIIAPSQAQWRALCERNQPDDALIAERVVNIVARVRREGDSALRDYAQQFDGVALDSLEVAPEALVEASAQVSPELRQAIAAAAKNIAAFHTAQRHAAVDVSVQPGVRCVQRAVPLQRVGLYIPGGGAPLFSTVLMLALPAAIAGCKETVLCTPCNRAGGIHPAILHAARVCGVHRVFAIGGAQGRAPRAYGTQSVPRVDKIFGPGNRYVTHAKQQVSTDVAIDMPAGPSEVLVLADHTAQPRYVAADLLSQAEHGSDSQAMLVCHSADFAAEVDAEVGRQAALCQRQTALEHSLRKSRIVVLPDAGDRIAFANAYAAEHLILACAEPWRVAEDITAAGSVFIGHYSPESAGDYASGTNHTLPTAGWARAYSGVNLDSYVRKITYQELTRDGLSALAPTILTMARAEGLDAHAAAVSVRLEA